MTREKILLLVEGAKTDVRLMEKLIQIYGIDIKYKIVSYNTNIYTLYKEMFAEGDPDSMDILQLLKEREQNPETRKIFDEKYSDILLIFDLDPHDPQFSEEKIVQMMEYFEESSDMGKLYLNYPMVEAFYHMKDIPDSEYNNYLTTIEELKARAYKQRVHQENRNKDYSKFANNIKECDIVITQNINKAWYILGSEDNTAYTIPELSKVLMKQLEKLKNEYEIFVLCTCAFFIVEYNPKLIID